MHAKKVSWRLTPVGDGEPVSARLLLAADGVHSTVARRLGLHETSRMRKVALVAHMRGIDGMGEYGEMHVAGRRYVGIAPLELPEVGDLCNVAMVVDEARDGRNLAGRPERFLLEALETFPKTGWTARLGDGDAAHADDQPYQRTRKAPLGRGIAAGR